MARPPGALTIDVYSYGSTVLLPAPHSQLPDLGLDLAALHGQHELDQVERLTRRLHARSQETGKCALIHLAGGS